MLPDEEQLRNVEHALRESEDRFRNVVEGSLQGILIHQDGIIRYVNPAMARMFDYASPAELVGRPLWEAFVLPENLPSLQERTRRILAGEPIPPHPGWRAVGKFGRDVWVATAASLIDWEGRPAVVAFYLDVTATKLATEERLRLEARIQQAQKVESLSVLAGGIAHDFNNLLTAILGYTGLAQEEVVRGRPGALALLRKIETSSIRAAELTRQMLAYAGKGKFIVESIDLSDVVQEMSNLLRTVVGKRARLRLDLAPAPVEGDATQLRQIVMNLITNAAEALEADGTITLRTGTRHADASSLASPHLHDDLPAGVYAYVEVSDTGCGMTPDIAARIFDPFFTTKFTGRGLGLAAALGIIRGHRGTIQVTSQPGVGTTFAVSLPVRTTVAPPVVMPPPSPDWQGEGTILVIDDEAALRDVAQRMLKSLGFTPLLARDGWEGVATFRAHADAIRAVLLDLTMPGLDGIDTFRELRHVRKNVRVVLSSGYSEDCVSERLEELRPAAFVAKPYRMETLKRAIGQALHCQEG